MRTLVDSQPYLRNSDALEQSNLTDQEINPALPFPLLIIIFPLLIIIAIMVAIIKTATKYIPL